MDSISYICKYTPLELLRSFNIEPQLLEGEQSGFEFAERCMHANVCCHAKATLQQTCNCESVFFTDCCDSMRRVHDVLVSGLAENNKVPHNATSCYMMDLPHTDDGCARRRLAFELMRVIEWLENACGKSFSKEAFLESFVCADECECAKLPGRPFVAIMGARTTKPLVLKVEQSVKARLDLPVVDLTCVSFRNIEHPPDDAIRLNTRELMDWYAGALLRMMPCMRMADISNRRQLLEAEYLEGIVYNTVKFCDYYGFDYAKLITETNVPVLKIESDFQPMASGQLSTRLDAFCETLDARSSNVAYVKSSAKHSRKAGADAMYFAGIDSGSTTTNMVVLNEAGDICASTIVRTGPKATRGAQQALDEVCAQLDASPDDFASIIATGYGRANIPFATGEVTEITCHAKGAHQLMPSVRSIIDIGGQDSKVICLNAQGAVENFTMNDKCAAGTGRFFEAMAHTLDLDIKTMAEIGLHYKKDITISSMCTVFAESEVISLIADDVPTPDIVHGLNKAIASRTAAMVRRTKAAAPYAMTGGVAHNQGVVLELSKILDAEIYVPECPDLCGAYGAALFAV